MNKTIPIAIIIVGVLIAGAVVYTNYTKCPEGASTEVQIISSQEAGEKMVNFIGDNILRGEVAISLIETLEEKGLYKVKFDVDGEEVEWRITKDGQLIFPQVIDLAEFESVPEPGPESGPASLEDFAKCLAEKGMKFYGASSCGWCQKQKELFGEAVQYLPYVECADEGSDELIAECQEAGVRRFPTWRLPDGEMSPGFKTLEELSELSGCSIE